MSSIKEQLCLLKVGTTVLKMNYLYPKRVTKAWLVSYALFLLTLNAITIGLYGHVWFVLYNYGFVYEMIADDIAGIISSHSVMYVFVVYAFVKDDIEALLAKYGDFTEFEKPLNIENVNKQLDFLSKMFAGYLYISGIILWIWQLYAVCESDDVSNCGLLVNAYLPIDIYSPIPRRIMMTLQIYSGFVSGTGTFFISWAYLSLGKLSVCYLKHLQNMLRVIPILKDKQKRRLHFHKCIRYHQRIISITTELTELSQDAMFVHVSTAAVIISVIAYQIIALDFQYIALVHLLAWFVAILLTSIFGEELLQESAAVGFAAYDSIPYDDPKIAKDLMMVILRSEVPLCFRGSKFAIIGHARFMGMMQTSYSFLTLLFNAE